MLPRSRVTAGSDIEGCGTGVRARWVPGWGIPGWVLGGLYRVPSHAARGDTCDSEAGPGSPSRGAGVGGHRGRANGGPVRLPDHPAGPVGPPCGPPCLGPLEWPSWTKGRDSDLISIKLVKTAECHQKCAKRPVIVPIFKNGSQMSPLDFLGFPYYAAFSHKELMGRFDPYV